MDRFTGKVAVVTGAASGLGKATAVRLADEGASVACIDLNSEGATSTAKAITAAGGKAMGLAADITKEGDVASAVQTAAAALGRPSILCNVAGIGRFAHSDQLAVDEWNAILGVNLTGTFIMSKAVLPHMLDGGGSIVNVASSAGLSAQPYSAAYCASKGGVIMLTKAMALEYLKKGVRINVVCPGGMDTPMIEGWTPPEGVPLKELMRMTSPMGMCQPEEVAASIAHVASDDARFMTGAVVSVDGGITL